MMYRRAILMSLLIRQPHIKIYPSRLRWHSPLVSRFGPTNTTTIDFLRWRRHRQEIGILNTETPEILAQMFEISRGAVPRGRPIRVACSTETTKQAAFCVFAGTAFGVSLTCPAETACGLVFGHGGWGLGPGKPRGGLGGGWLVVEGGGIWLVVMVMVMGD